MYIRAVKASLYLVLATLFWSGNFVVGQAAVASMTPLDLTFWRWTLAALPLLALAHFVENPDWRAVLRRWPVLLLLSVLGMSGYTLLLYGALGYTSAHERLADHCGEPGPDRGDGHLPARREDHASRLAGHRPGPAGRAAGTDPAANCSGCSASPSTPAN